MTTIKRFEDIEAWKTASELTILIYHLTGRSDFSRDFSLKDQIQRAVVSVMSNIAEGFESQTQAQFIRYLGHAKASAGEIRSQPYLALDIGYLSAEQFRQAFDLADKAIRQIYRFMEYLERHRGTRRVGDESPDYDENV